MNERIKNYLKLFLADNNFERIIAKINDKRLISYYGDANTNKNKMNEIKEKLGKIVGEGIISEVQTVENEDRKFLIEILNMETFEEEFEKFAEKRFQEGEEYWEVKILEKSKDEEGNICDVYVNSFRFKEKIDAIVFIRLYDSEEVISVQKTTVFDFRI